jgi:hypothetical protein
LNPPHFFLPWEKNLQAVDIRGAILNPTSAFFLPIKSNQIRFLPNGGGIPGPAIIFFLKK